MKLQIGKWYKIKPECSFFRTANRVLLLEKTIDRLDRPNYIFTTDYYMRQMNNNIQDIIRAGEYWSWNESVVLESVVPNSTHIQSIKRITNVKNKLGRETD